MTGVRSRDDRCCIGGHLVAGEDYTGFEAAHIFPLSETDIVNEFFLVVSIPVSTKLSQVE